VLGSACWLVAAGLAVGCDLEHSGREPVGAGPPVTTGPAPGPSAEVYGCGLPRGHGDGVGCPEEEAHFLDDVVRATDITRFQHPEWFEGDHVRDGHVGDYMDQTVENLRRMGFCAFNDGEEVAVKSGNDFSDQYDIITSAGNVWHKYTATCRPAWSAIPPAGNGS
jgi:hypothetical protein